MMGLVMTIARTSGWAVRLMFGRIERHSHPPASECPCVASTARRRATTRRSRLPKPRDRWFGTRRDRANWPLPDRSASRARARATRCVGTSIARYTVDNATVPVALRFQRAGLSPSDAMPARPRPNRGEGHDQQTSEGDGRLSRIGSRCGTDFRCLCLRPPQRRIPARRRPWRVWIWFQPRRGLATALVGAAAVIVTAPIAILAAVARAPYYGPGPDYPAAPAAYNGPPATQGYYGAPRRRPITARGIRSSVLRSARRSVLRSARGSLLSTAGRSVLHAAVASHTARRRAAAITVVPIVATTDLPAATLATTTAIRPATAVGPRGPTTISDNSLAR